MRLIDADKLKIHDVSPAYGYTVMGVEEEEIDDAETVDAIPVEWIKDIIRRCLEIMKSNMLDFYTLTNYSLVAQLLAQLLERWEEENDVSRIGK